MRFILIVIPIFLLSFWSCQPSINKELHKAELLIKTAPDSAKYLLNEIEKDYPSMNRREKALFGLLFSQLSNNNTPYLKELIDFSIDYYSRGNIQNQKHYLSLCYFFKSRILSQDRQDADAVVYLYKAKEQGESEKNYWLLARIYFDLGQIAINQDETEKSLKYFSKSAEYFEKSQEKEHQSNVFMIINWLHQLLGNYDIAIEYSFNALDLATDSITKGNVINGIGYSYFLLEKSDSALYYMKYSLEYPSLEINRSLRNYMIAKVYQNLQKEDSVYFYLNKALQYEREINIEKEIYEMLVDWSIKNGEKDKVAYYIEKQRIAEDSVKKIENQPKIDIVEHIYHSEREITKVKNQRVLLIVSVIFVLLAGLLTFFYLQKNKRNEQNKALVYKTELEKKGLELKLKELKNEIEKAKIRYKDIKKKAVPSQHEQIEKTCYNEVLHIDNENLFMEKMNKVLNNFPHKLQGNYPSISYKEIVWCCLYILDISTLDISLLLDLTLSSQYKFKQRLAKKLHFTSTKELEKMLKAVMY
jgi:hypothetical protein